MTCGPNRLENQENTKKKKFDGTTAGKVHRNEFTEKKKKEGRRMGEVVFICIGSYKKRPSLSS
jgi:hypothetical protein